MQLSADFDAGLWDEELGIERDKNHMNEVPKSYASIAEGLPLRGMLTCDAHDEAKDDISHKHNKDVDCKCIDCDGEFAILELDESAYIEWYFDDYLDGDDAKRIALNLARKEVEPFYWRKIIDSNDFFNELSGFIEAQFICNYSSLPLSKDHLYNEYDVDGDSLREDESDCTHFHIKWV